MCWNLGEEVEWEAGGGRSGGGWESMDHSSMILAEFVVADGTFNC